MRNANYSVLERFYNEKHQNRSLKWLFAQGNCQITTSFFDKKYLFICSNYQVLILLLFNRTVKEYTMKDIVILTQIALEELEVTLMPLVRVGILNIWQKNVMINNNSKVIIILNFLLIYFIFI